MIHSATRTRPQPTINALLGAEYRAHSRAAYNRAHISAHHPTARLTNCAKASCAVRKSFTIQDFTAEARSRARNSSAGIGASRPSLTGFSGPLMGRGMKQRIYLDLAILVAFVVASYGLRMDKLSIRGEESRWATVAMEMQRTGDWVVPRQQGEPFLSRPPMGSWLIAAAASIRGECDPIAVRLPTILAVLATTLLIYGYGRSFLGRAGSLGAAIGFAAMPEVLQMGRLAESDAVFAFFLGGSLVVWHWGHSRGWPAALTWAVAYFLAACGTLTKGPQAPVYFAAAVSWYLVATGQWRHLLAPAHLFGIGIYVLTVGAWLAPFAAELGLRDSWAIVTGDSTDRFVNLSAWAVVRHMVAYPFELLGCTAP